MRTLFKGRPRPTNARSKPPRTLGLVHRLTLALKRQAGLSRLELGRVGDRLESLTYDRISLLNILQARRCGNFGKTAFRAGSGGLGRTTFV